MVICANRFILSSLAFSPLRVREEEGKKVVYLNPFGTYWGKQKFHPTYGNGNGYLLTLNAAHLKSLAPFYNGVKTRFILGIFSYFDGMDEKLYEKIKAFSDSGYVLIPENDYCYLNLEDNVILKKEVSNAEMKKKKLTISDVPVTLFLKVLIRGAYSKIRY